MEMTLKRAAELFARSLPRKPVDDDPDAAPIKIPWKRYVAIEDAVLELYRKADARTMPLDVFEIANSIGYAPVPYRLLGPVLYPVFMAASEDGVSMWWLGDKGGIFYNDRKPLLRQRFTIAHELGHVMLGHKEHSNLAEMEAGHFAAAALCPLPLMSLYGIRDAHEISRIFRISEESARLRLQSLHRWEGLDDWKRNKRFGDEVRQRFQLLEPYQTLMFQEKSLS